jgi:hypothetical protein
VAGTAAPPNVVPAGPAVTTGGVPLAPPQVGSLDPLSCVLPDPMPDDPQGNKFNLFGCAWASADFLAYWVKSAPNPVPLVTTAPAGGTGFLGSPTTTPVFGGTSGFDYGPLYGGRFSVGFCEPQYVCGFEVTAFYLSSRSTTFSTASSAAGAPLLARPFFDPILGLEDAQLISFPGAFAGRFTVNTAIDLWGVEANVLRHKITHTWKGDMHLAGACLDTDLIAGFRFVNLNESLNMVQNSTVLPGGVAGFAGATVIAPSALTIADQFLTTNNFYGGQLGFQSMLHRGAFFSSLTAKVALGETYQVADIAGTTTLARATGPVATVPGGLFALPSNIGLHSRNAFSVVPEVGLNVGFELWKHVRIYGGYNFLYWSNVARPGDQIDRAVDKTQLPSSLAFTPASTAIRPLTTLQSSDFWAHGVNVGVAIGY